VKKIRWQSWRLLRKSNYSSTIVNVLRFQQEPNSETRTQYLCGRKGEKKPKSPHSQSTIPQQGRGLWTELVFGKGYGWSYKWFDPHGGDEGLFGLWQRYRPSIEFCICAPQGTPRRDGVFQQKKAVKKRCARVNINPHRELVDSREDQRQKTEVEGPLSRGGMV